MWVEAGTPEENPRVQEGDHHNLSHTASVDHGDRAHVAAVTSKCIVHYATLTPCSSMCTQITVFTVTK